MNKEEFKKEVMPLSAKMYRLSYRLLNDTEMSKDCVQESLLKMWENRKKLKQVENLPAYACRIVRNIAIDRLRKTKRIQEFFSIPVLNSVESNYESVENKHIIQQLINNLPQQQRMIMELRDIEEFSYEEMAEALNLTVNNIRVNLSIARRKIREELIKIYNYGLTKD
jgi:RNA polymerase sigma factor (sigma-70 family)